ncbi:L,D-transpeptidase [Hoeflea sp.]|uniref:L,D-transpeptidase n=1 Tax=Hoeflea sp. TaxID=1940281 RepID=UPI003B01C5B1
MNKARSGQPRRAFLYGLGSFGLLTAAGCTTASDPDSPTPGPDIRPLSSNALYGALPNEKFPIPAVKPGQLQKKYQRRRVRYRSSEAPGTVIVDTRNFYLYHLEPGGNAMRYGVGLGRAGFAWSGRARIAWKRKWPTWTPPEEMIKREPHLSKWSADNGGMPPGLSNPLGSRALYIFQGNRDTLYRLHGTPEVASIGRAVSSGCVRLVNQDVIHLYDRVKPGSTIVVT